MATRRTSPKEPTDAPDELRAAIASDTLAVGADIAKLREGDVVRLRRILAGEEVVGYPVSLKRAWGALARSDPSPATGQVLGQALSAHTLPHRDRMVAAMYLGLLPPVAAEAPLLAALPGSSGNLRAEIVRSLGQVGTARALADLKRIKYDGDESTRRQLALAQLAIRLRERKASRTGLRMAAELGIGWREVEARAVSAGRLRQTLAAFRGPSYGVLINPDIGLQFQCGGKRHFVLFNQALSCGSLVGDLAARGLIAGIVVAEGDKGMKHFVLRWLLFTSPAGEGVDVALVRPSGEPVLSGRAVPDGRHLAFALRDTGLERSPIEVAGRVTNRDVRWTLRIWVGALRDKARPRAMLPQAVLAAG